MKIRDWYGEREQGFKSVCEELCDLRKVTSPLLSLKFQINELML